MPNNLPSRREVLRAAATIGAAAAVTAVGRDDAAQSPTTELAKPLCYVDGYHGGVDGHMPPDSLRNVMDGLDAFPHWKVSFEIEPYSWAVFAGSDPASIDRLRRFLDDGTPAARVELVSGAYGQPYMWNISGESIIRHLMRGREEIAAVFPKVRVDTYAVQEPCWTSCLPGLLSSMGYRRAVLKNSTCWGGYHAATINADLVNWVAPDGRGISAVPRYACEKLVPPASEESAQPPVGFVERCAAAGIAHPAGTILQDMGWPGRPWRLGINEQVFHSLRHVIWREYVDTIADAPTKQWTASQEDVRCGLAWGAPVLQRISQVVRYSENRIVQAEKLASMALVRSAAPVPADELHRAWTHLLLSQHHDVWIVPTNHHHGGTWASEAGSRHTQTVEICGRIIKSSTASMTPTSATAGHAARSVRVFNTSGFRRRDIVHVPVDPEARAWQARDANGKVVPCQSVTSGSAKAGASVLVAVEVPPLGYTTCRLEEVKDLTAAGPEGALSATRSPDGSFVLETDLYKLTIDPAKGGRISSLVMKALSREFVDDASPRSFNEFRGYFANESKWLSSTDAAATVTVIETGPLRIAVKIDGRIGDYPFTTTLSMAAGQRRIDFTTALQFPVDGDTDRGSRLQKLRIGEPSKNGIDAGSKNRRYFYDSSYKLQALFPAALKQPTLYKNAAFDVCQSGQADTRFGSWETIKHNVIVNWVDLMGADGSAGLALLSDHTTAYSHGNGEPLGLVMCYAGPGVWFDYTLDRAPSVSYALVPHAGDWRKSQLSRELAKWSEPLEASMAQDQPGDEAEWSLADASQGSVEITAVYDRIGSTYIRLFNASNEAAEQEIRLARNFREVALLELDDRVIGTPRMIRDASGARSVIVKLPRFGVGTLRLTSL